MVMKVMGFHGISVKKTTDEPSFCVYLLFYNFFLLLLSITLISIVLLRRFFETVETLSFAQTTASQSDAQNCVLPLF